MSALAPALHPAAQARHASAERRRGLAVAVSVAVHVAIFSTLAVRLDAPKVVEPPPVEVALVEGLTLTEPAPVRAPAPPKPDQPPPPRNIFRPTPAPRAPAPLPAERETTADTTPSLSDGDLVGAATAESGPPGGACNMPKRIQVALRKDNLVQAAVAEAHRANAGGKAMIVWNGDWVRSQGQEGKGLAALRQAIVWEVAFAPPACRAEAVHGLVLISLNDGAGSARLVLGGGDWRWADLLRLS